jgi:hypothetical protein
MVQVTVELSDEDAARLAERARQEHTTPEQVAVDTLHRSLVPPLDLGFASLGRSGRHDVSERAEEILRAELGS